MKKYFAEFLGTAVLVLFGCGAAAFSLQQGLGQLGIAMSFGLSIVAMAYAIGHVSGCHVNPAVSFAVFLNGGLSIDDFIGYVLAQFLGGFVGTGLLKYLTGAFSGEAFSNSELGANLSNVGVVGGLVVEIILTFVFVLVILGVTSDAKYQNVSGLVIGLTLCFVHILGIPLTGTSVNPARSLAPAVFNGGIFLDEVWVYIVGPLVGATIAALLWKYCLKPKAEAKTSKVDAE